MAHKTFISYKYSEARELRDRIITKLGNDATYYRGETSSSPDLTDLTTATIRKNLADMIYDTSVMIVIVSPRKGARPFRETRKNTFPIFRPAFPRFWIRRAHRPF